MVHWCLTRSAHRGFTVAPNLQVNLLGSSGAPRYSTPSHTLCLLSAATDSTVSVTDSYHNQHVHCHDSACTPAVGCIPDESHSERGYSMCECHRDTERVCVCTITERKDKV